MMSPASGTEVYARIFAEVPHGSGDGRALAQAIARAVRTLREAMEKEDNRAVTAAHVRNLRDIDPEALAMAYAMAEKFCVHWPTAGEMREFAGWSHESRSKAGLEWVFGYLEKHGAEGRPRGGAVLFGEDGTGRRVLLKQEAVVAAPPIPAEIEAVLSVLGSGSAKQGLRYVSQHPNVKGWDGFSGDHALRSAERVEAQWTRCSLYAMRKSRKGANTVAVATTSLIGEHDDGPTTAG
jgi:hypothetical protein